MYEGTNCIVFLAIGYFLGGFSGLYKIYVLLKIGTNAQYVLLYVDYVYPSFINKFSFIATYHMV